MALPTNTYHSYTAKGQKESFEDAVYDTSPTDTPFLSMLPRVKVGQKLHQWQTDALAAAANNKKLEGDDIAGDAQTATTLFDNYCQISWKAVTASGTLQATEKWGRGKDEIAYLMAKAAKELKRDMDYALCQNTTYDAGAAGTERQLRGLEGWIFTNDLLGTSGVSPNPAIGTNSAPTDGTQRAFTESLLRSAHKLCFDEGGEPTILMVGPYNRGVVDTFTGYSTRTSESASKKLVATIDVYVGPFGQLKVVTERQQRDRTAFLLDTDYWALGQLRAPHRVKLSKTGDNEKEAIVVEYTLISKNQKASGAVRDLTTS